jgi:hypothetical protein
MVLVAVAVALALEVVLEEISILHQMAIEKQPVMEALQELILQPVKK